MARPARNEDGSPGPTKIKSEISRLCAGAGRRARNTLNWRAVPCAPALPGEYGAAVHNYGCCAGYVNPDSEEAEASAANKRGRMQRDFRRVEASANSFSRWTLRSDELGSSLLSSTPSTGDVVVGVAPSVAGRAAGQRGVGRTWRRSAKGASRRAWGAQPRGRPRRAVQRWTVAVQPTYAVEAVRAGYAHRRAACCTYAARNR